ncbi:hypothetical protein [Bifidobacterium vespertilionis]|uniref:ABC transporter permease n=1 Tax=Bifidobacterium vespertilionis TaxID=2562524 RepID=A0A5J5DXV9_9BIFI|nr:hypothetical protein [Bifidobacterium vespertilionis]KAA8821562.1 hypothetical protein EMO90_02725 [Bifidobacterium vespertilionis]KAA8824642.1 hypothetical protein EM848_00020 [Bifidobacterium vespertilionis]
MRLSELVGEALRNIGSGTAKAIAFLIAVMVSATLLGGYEANTVIAQETEAVTRINSYADVSMILGGAPIDGGACDRLVTSVNGPQAAGAMRTGPTVAPASTPGKSLSSYEVTPGMLGLIAMGDQTRRLKADANGIWVSRDVANDFGLVTGGSLQTTNGTVRVAGVFDWPNDGRDTRFAYAVLTPSSTDASRTYQECWAKQWPGGSSLTALLYTTVISGGSADSAGPTSGVMQLNKSFGQRYDATALYFARVTRFMPVIGLAVGLLIGAVSVRRRRLEYAGALHSGQRKTDQLFEVGVETLIWAGLGALASAGLLTAYCWRWAPSSPDLVLLTALRTPLSVFAGTMIASLAATLLIRESQLFRLFKTR